MTWSLIHDTNEYIRNVQRDQSNIKKEIILMNNKIDSLTTNNLKIIEDEKIRKHKK